MGKEFMVVERFRAGKSKEFYEKFDKNGRLLPAGVEYLKSWVDESVSICFQHMRSESLELLEQWISQWEEFAEFEIYPIISSAEAREKSLNGHG